MRIIHAAKRQQERISKCDYCHSILGITEDDLFLGVSNWGYKCPVCSESNYFVGAKSDIFPWIMEEENEIQSDNSMRQHEV